MHSIDTVQRWQAKGAALYFANLPLDDAWWSEAPAAREMAIDLHKAQTRKDSNLPYATHLAEVALIVSLFHKMGFLSDEELGVAIRCTWLHDSIEDQGATRDQIAAAFDEETGDIVDALSKRPKSIQMPDPMADSLHRINQAGKVASLIKIADRISNLSTKPPESWSIKSSKRYAQEARTIIATLAGNLPQGACLILESIASDYIARHCVGSRAAKP